MSRGQYEFDVWSYIARMGIRLRPARETFFLDGDAVCAMRTCQYITQEDCEEFLHVDYRDFSCSAPGCQAKFSQLIDSEAHYNAVHRHACSVCKKSLPTAHLLELHVTESHDSYFQVMSVKKPSYECFLEKCNLKFWNADDRKQHSINEHSFPADFKFDTRDKNGGSSKSKKKSKLAKKDDEEKMDQDAVPVVAPKAASSQGTNSNIKSSMDVDAATVIKAPATPKFTPTPKSPTTPKSPQKFRPDEVRLRQQPTARQSPSHKARPVSAFVPSLSLDSKSDQNSSERTKIPVSSRTPPTYHRRLSLNAASAASSNKSEATQSPPVVKRAPLSLARMGERISYYGGSSIDVSSSDQTSSSTPTPLASSVSTTAIPSTTSSNNTLPRSRIPSPTKSGSGSGGGGTISKKSSSSSIPTTPKKLSCEESPSRSRIPVLRSSSYRVPRTISFGFGVPKVFPMHGKKSGDQSGKHWHQLKSKEDTKRIHNNIENANFDEMRMALD